MTKYWDEAWAKVQREQLDKTKIHPSEWKAAGRATKANPNKEDGAWWTTNGKEMVDSWINWRKNVAWKIWEAQPGVPAIELALTPIWNDIPVQMHIDRVMVTPEGELVVLDIKTGSRTPSSDLQLGFYAAGLEAMLGVRPQYGAYWMAREGSIGEMIDLNKYTLDVIIDLVTKFDTARKHEIFLPNLNHCVMCGLTKDCKWKQ